MSCGDGAVSPFSPKRGEFDGLLYFAAALLLNGLCVASRLYLNVFHRVLNIGRCDEKMRVELYFATSDLFLRRDKLCGGDVIDCLKKRALT